MGSPARETVCGQGLHPGRTPMIRRVLLTAAGLFTAVCVACAPAPVMPPPSPPPPERLACAYDNIGMLPADFRSPKNPYFTPMSSGTPPSPNIVADVQRAVALAPPFFQDKLCQLDGI